MSLSVGIVGLPNVGKSTIFNAITNGSVQARNYPFCTIEPNTGVISVPNKNLELLSQISSSAQTIFSSVTFTDIAGLVKGASKNEGLGNQFLSSIRSVSVIAHVVRCFHEEDIVHVHGRISPLDDIEVINTELLLSDLQMVEKLLAQFKKKTKTLDASLKKKKLSALEKVKDSLNRNCPVRQMNLDKEEREILREYAFLSHKKVIYLANISESEINQKNAYADCVGDYAHKNKDEFYTISAKIEEEISRLNSEEKEEFLTEIGLKFSGLDIISKKCFDLLGLQNYFTTGEKESRAWIIEKGTKAPQAAGVIHSDFERGFIRANIVSCKEFIFHQGWKGCKEKGLIRQEGSDYIMQEEDVVEFLFNV